MGEYDIGMYLYSIFIVACRNKTHFQTDSDKEIRSFLDLVKVNSIVLLWVYLIKHSQTVETSRDQVLIIHPAFAINYQPGLDTPSQDFSFSNFDSTTDRNTRHRLQVQYMSLCSTTWFRIGWKLAIVMNWKMKFFYYYITLLLFLWTFKCVFKM